MQVRDHEHVHDFPIVVIQLRVGKLGDTTLPDAGAKDAALLRRGDDAIKRLRDGFAKHCGESGSARFVKARGFLDVARGEAVQAMRRHAGCPAERRAIASSSDTVCARPSRIARRRSSASATACSGTASAESSSSEWSRLSSSASARYARAHGERQRGVFHGIHISGMRVRGLFNRQT